MLLIPALLSFIIVIAAILNLRHQALTDTNRLATLRWCSF